MLTREGCLKRRERLWAAVPQQIEWLLIADPRHVQYLANFWVQPLSFSGGERGLLLLERDRGATLIGDNFALRAAANAPYVDREVIETWYDHKHAVINRDHALLKALGKATSHLGAAIGLVEAESLPLGAAEVLGGDFSYALAEGPESDGTYTDLGTALRALRRQKEPDEIALLRQCMRAGDAGHARIREILRPGLSELELYLEVQRAAIAAAGRPALVYGDFRATNGSQPKAGGLPVDYKVQDGDLYILDYSVVLDGYRSDFTNTYAVGTPSAELREMFALCQRAMTLAESKLRAGEAARVVHRAAVEPFLAAGRPELFTHHAGHGIGLAHPEAPILVPESTDVLVAGDVLTLEPGAYQAGIGGMRIEHNYLITPTGFERLSGHKISLD